MENEMLGDRKRKGLYKAAKQRSVEANKQADLEEKRKLAQPQKSGIEPQNKVSKDKSLIELVNLYPNLYESFKTINVERILSLGFSCFGRYKANLPLVEV
ncbi:hypothetical protein ACFLZZ_04005 [Nanoarchaeota archaeon]